jgi:HD-GYP domain-containing protein (c-di-GMP phosphodiesterase class II)
MENLSGKHFDPECLRAFRKNADVVGKIQGMLPDIKIAK